MPEENRLDPICGMAGSIPAYGHYFCSTHCIKKYEEEQGIEPGTYQKEAHEHCPSCQILAPKWYQEKLFGVIALLIVVLGLQLLLNSLGLRWLNRFSAAFYQYGGLVWLPILIGLLLGGIIDYFVPRSYIMKHLGRHKKRTVFYAVGLGFLMTACSHGILAIAVELYKKGASTAAVISFLLAAPWANLPVTILLFGFFGFKALLFIFSALIIAVITGLIYQFLDKKKLVECKYCDTVIDENFSMRSDIKRRFKELRLNRENILKAVTGVLQGSWNLSKMILWWIIIGMILASVAQAYVPAHFFHKFMGANFLGLLVTLGFATVLEICSEGTAPLAFEIYRQTGAFGNAFVFLMAGVATDYTEIGLIWTNIGRRAAIWLPVINVPIILLLGWLFNHWLR